MQQTRNVRAIDDGNPLNAWRDLLKQLQPFSCHRLGIGVETGNVAARACKALNESKPDGVVTDVEMPGVSGIDAGREIVRRGLCDVVVMLSMYSGSLAALAA